MKQTFRSAFIKIFALGVFFSGNAAIAQHCPFDGAYMVIVELTDADDKPILGSMTELTLQEIENPAADSCRYSKGLLSHSFLPPADAFQDRYSRNGLNIFSRYCEDCAFNTFGFYAVVLGQSERSCMIKNDLDVDYRRITRKFEVRYAKGGIKQKIAVPPNKIYSMCTGQGKWSRFEPIKLQINRVAAK